MSMKSLLKNGNYLKPKEKNRAYRCRICLVLIVCLFVQLTNSKVLSQTSGITLDLKNASIEEVLNVIESKTVYRFLYNKQLVDVTKKVSIESTNQGISKVLSEIFKDTDISFSINGIQIVLSKSKNDLSQPVIKITGSVTDLTGEAVIGATIIVRGTRIATITNSGGLFNLEVPENSVITISYVGYKPQDIRIGNVRNFAIKLEENVENLDEVVVTALGIKREQKALGYSVQTVSGENLQKVSGVDVGTSLTGKIAGLLVENSTDFGTAPVLTIRGETPILVVDGVPYENKTISDISSEDIESMSVLKGATASALYGFRGASGAIMVTTKNGSGNKSGVTVEATTNTMFSAGYLAIPQTQSVYGRGDGGIYDKNNDSSWGPKISGQTLNQWDPILKVYRDYPYLAVGKNNFQNFLEQGYVTNNNINVGYRNDIVSLRSSVNWTENKGQYPNSTLDKYTYTLGGDINLKKFKLSSNVSYARKYSPNLGSNGYTSYDPMYSLLIWSSPDYNILDYKNNYWVNKGQTQNWTYAWGSNNPYYDRYQRTNEVSRDIFNTDLTMSYDITDWLKATLRSGLDFYIDRGQLRTSWGSYLYTGNTGVPGNQYTWNGYMTGGYNIGQTQGSSINSDFLLTGNRSFSNFTVDYLAGGSIFYKDSYNMNASTQGGISVPEFFSLAASVNTPSVGQITQRQQVNSLYGRVALSWNKLIYVDATGRNDWSSTLPSNTRSYFYPSVSGSFVISELLPDTKNWLDIWKVRSSWTMSKQPAAIYDSKSVYTVNSPEWGTLNGAQAPTSIKSSTLLPQSANTFEIGTQATMFKNRLMVDFSYYNKFMYNALTEASLSSATGYSSTFINSKEQQSRRGWELELSGTPIKNKDWQLDLGVNLSGYATYYVKLDSINSPKGPWVKVGNRVDAFVSNDYVRDPSGNLVFNNGRLQYSQYGSNFGWTDPDFVWGIHTTLRYKNLSLYVSFDGAVGGIMNTRTESYMWQAGIHPNSVTAARALDVATPGSKNFIGKGVKVVSGTVTYDQYGNITSDTRVFAPNDIPSTYEQYITDLHSSSAWGGAGSPADTYSKTFLKLREISLTYTVPNKFLHGWAKAASVSFVGQNVLLWAKQFKYSDPDGGHEDFSDPSVRYLGGNIKVTF